MCIGEKYLRAFDELKLHDSWLPNSQGAKGSYSWVADDSDFPKRLKAFTVLESTKTKSTTDL